LTGESSENLIPSFESTFGTVIHHTPPYIHFTMGPDRTHPHRKNAKAGPSTTPGAGKPLPYDKRDGSGVPGVSKLKASIRQTKRFLTKVSSGVDRMTLANVSGHSRAWIENIDGTTSDITRG
jgi:hypothetical protein